MNTNLYTTIQIQLTIFEYLLIQIRLQFDILNIENTNSNSGTFSTVHYE